MRRLLIFASILVFFDVAFYAAIAPLLPDYVAQFGLSKAQAGVLAASYAIGTLVSSLPAGILANRIGPRRTVIGGLLLLGVSSVVFGFGTTIVVLDLARFCQGVAGALVWSGTLTWLIATAPPERRGSVIGTALGTAVAGALVGPVLGSMAAELGTELIFGSVMAVAIALAAVAARMPEVGGLEHQALGEVLTKMASRPVLSAVGFVAVPSLMFGAVEVLVPLRIDDLGGGHVLIAAGFIIGAALEGVLAPLSGRYSDRFGRRSPLVLGMGLAAGAMVGLALANSLDTVLLFLICGSLGAGICFTPALTALSEAADASRLNQGFAAGLSNMAWSAGQMMGALAGGGIAGAAGYTVPSLAIALLLVLTAAYAYRTMPVPAVRVAEG